MRDVRSEFEIDPTRCFLAGASASGIPTYACALARRTPFTGFLLLNGSFEIRRLPSLVPAKGRRFYLQASASAPSLPSLQQRVIGDELARYGAVVKRVALRGGQGYDSLKDPAQALQDAVAWLESDRPMPTQKPHP